MRHRIRLQARAGLQPGEVLVLETNPSLAGLGAKFVKVDQTERLLSDVDFWIGDEEIGQ